MLNIEKLHTNLFYQKYVNEIYEKLDCGISRNFRINAGIVENNSLVVETKYKIEDLFIYRNFYIILNLSKSIVNELEYLRDQFEINDTDIGYSKYIFLYFSNGNLIEKTLISDEKIILTFNFDNISKLNDEEAINEFQNRYNYILKLLYNDNIEILENRYLTNESRFNLFKYKIDYTEDNLGDIPELFKKLLNHVE